MAELKGIKTENMFTKVEFFIYQQKFKNNQAKQWKFYKMQIIEILNETFSNYQKDKELLKL
jgi:hypothetical protein